MYATGMLGMVVMSGDREKDARAIVSVMHEIGVGGLNVEIVMDNESSLQSVVNAALLKSNCWSFHPSEACVSGEATSRIFTNWLALQDHLQVRLALEAPVMGYLIGHVYRMFNVFQFCIQKNDDVQEVIMCPR